MPQWTHFVFVGVVGIIAVMTAGVGVHSLKYRNKQGYKLFCLIMADCSLWSISCVMRMISSTPELSLFWFRVYFIAASTLPVLWFAFALQYTGFGKVLTGRRITLLMIIPTITMLLSWLDYKHGWFWTLDFYKEGVFMFADLDRGPGYFLHCIYSYTIAFIGVCLIIWTALRSFHMYRRQALALFVAALVPTITSLSSVLGITRVSFGSIGFGLGGLLFIRAVSKYRLLDLLPVAREALVSEMCDAVFVLDDEDRILDLNPATEVLFRCSVADCIGRHISEAWQQDSEFVEQLCGRVRSKMEIKFKRDGRIAYYDLSTSAFKDIQGHFSGRMIVLRDITQRKEAEKDKERLIGELREALSKVKTLSGMLPICSSCKKIRDDEGYWHQVESYVKAHSEAEFTHGICPDCMHKLYPDVELED